MEPRSKDNEDKSNVFISYSHTDTSLVNPVVKLLRVNQSFVFQDHDTIKPGSKWQESLIEALADTNVVVIFWCGHAHHSEEVKKEWSMAMDKGKDIVPLLLDETPLPDELK